MNIRYVPDAGLDAGAPEWSRQTVGDQLKAKDIRSQRRVMTYRIAAGRVKALERGARVCQEDTRKTDTLGSRNRIAAQGPGNIGELKIVWGGWNAGSKPGSVRKPGCTHTQSMWGALGPMSGPSQPLEVLGRSLSEMFALGTD